MAASRTGSETGGAGTARPRGPGKGERTRARLLSAAVEAVSRNGAEGASFAAMADLVGVDRSLIRHYFGTRERLLAECLSHAVSEGRSLIAGFLGERPELAASLEGYVLANFHWLRRQPHHVAFLLLCLQRSAYDVRLRRRVQAVFDGSRRTLEPLVGGGSRARRDVERRAAIVHELILGSMALQATSGRRGEAVDEAERRCLDAVATLSRAWGLGATPSGR